jgi:hypothetical protein
MGMFDLIRLLSGNGILMRPAVPMPNFAAA